MILPSKFIFDNIYLVSTKHGLYISCGSNKSETNFTTISVKSYDMAGFCKSLASDFSRIEFFSEL
jgi:hypothetical protein